MTKIYVVKAIDTTDGYKVIAEVFTNKAKAEAFAKYYNAGNGTFRYEVEEKTICKSDYRKLLKLPF